MSSSTQNDLQSVENKSIQAPASVAIIEPSPDTRINIEYTASLVSKCGLWIESRIMANFGNNVVNTMFFFLRSSDPFHAFYQHKIAEYRNAQRQDIPPDAPAIKWGFTFKDLPLEPRTCQLFRLKELDIIKLTAQFVVRYGMRFWRDLMNRAMKDPLFAFMEPADCSFSLFSRLIDAYARVLRPYYSTLKRPGAILESFFNLLGEKLQEEGVEMHAFVGGLDYFAGREDQELHPPGHLSTQMQDPIRDTPRFPLTYPEGITPKELGIFKLTAQFVARYGRCFERDLMKRVIDDPQFEFLKSTSDSCGVFHGVVASYTIAVMPCQKLMKPGACTETVVEGFLNLLLGGDDKQVEGVEMAMTGVHAFVGGLPRLELSPSVDVENRCYDLQNIF